MQDGVHDILHMVSALRQAMREQAVAALQPQPAACLLSQPVGAAAQLCQFLPPRALWDGCQVGRKAEVVGPRPRDCHILLNLTAARVCQLRQECILAGSGHLLHGDCRRRRQAYPHAHTAKAAATCPAQGRRAMATGHNENTTKMGNPKTTPYFIFHSFIRSQLSTHDNGPQRHDGQTGLTLPPCLPRASQAPRCQLAPLVPAARSCRPAPALPPGGSAAACAGGRNGVLPGHRRQPAGLCSATPVTPRAAPRRAAPRRVPPAQAPLSLQVATCSEAHGRRAGPPGTADPHPPLPHPLRPGRARRAARGSWPPGAWQPPRAMPAGKGGRGRPVRMAGGDWASEVRVHLCAFGGWVSACVWWGGRGGGASRPGWPPAGLEGGQQIRGNRSRSCPGGFGPILPPAPAPLRPPPPATRAAQPPAPAPVQGPAPPAQRAAGRQAGRGRGRGPARPPALPLRQSPDPRTAGASAQWEEE